LGTNIFCPKCGRETTILTILSMLYYRCEYCNIEWDEDTVMYSLFKKREQE